MNAIAYVGEHPRTFEVRWHSHELWRLVYCTGGEGAFHLEGGTLVPYRQGQVVAIPPGASHMNLSEEGFTNIHLSMRDPAFPYKSPFVVDDDEEEHIRKAFTEAKFYYLSDIRGRELILAALGDLIVSYMIVFQNYQHCSESVEQIRASIIRNVSNPRFALDQEIRRLPFHYDYLRRLFKREMGLTPLEYLTSLRMKKAEELLTGLGARERSMAEVAECCGFSDPLYFSRVFKKHFGCSPSAFAKRGMG